MNENDNEPKIVKSLLGSSLPTGQSEDNKYERKKIYKRDAIVFASIMTAIDVVGNLSIYKYKLIEFTSNNNLNLLITAMIDFVIVYIIAYMIGQITGEKKIK